MSTIIAKGRKIGRRVRDSYMDLIRRFPLRPIRDERRYDEAVAVMEKLAVRGDENLDVGESDYLDVLSDLIEAYDERHYQIPNDAHVPHERLASLMRDSEMTRADLAELLSVSPTLVSLMLAGKRELSKDSIRKLADRFKLDAGYFL